ncbi:MAG: Gfo/Idh/MocA family oxidoreductase [Kiritimatiellae bacterium]|nr:Gfo/Idh/MocA family oxidoreductase [Kiritimatiellia bacterium]MDD3544240.1 Gfo/Idh/MocA family oxidoreductase [Kiritimatiellia bacterium]MDD4622080.1 Gfo/Idh/MocA family oxidoreductase [Kiritimatiellia bacterium]
MNRRRFITASALGAAGCFTGCATARGTRVIAPNSKLNHACIGVGGMGGADISNIKTHAHTQIVALCDVDRSRLEKAAQQFPGARVYTDWRELLAKEGDRIDSVNIAVPDHNHTIIATNAMRAGKHVYCQKPLCHEIAECRLLKDTARRRGVVTQLGVQWSAQPGDRMAVAHHRAGVIGAVEHIYLFSNRKGVSRIRAARPAAGEPVPASLEWDLWIGTAPFRPYSEKIYHPLIWRIWQDFGSGWIGDIGCHLHSSVWKGLGLTEPLSVKAEVQTEWKNNPASFKDIWPQGAHITWVYPGVKASGGKPLTVEWFDGMTGEAAPNLLPPPELQELAREVGLEKLPAEGSVTAGSEGWMILPHSAGPRLVLKNRQAAKPPKPVLPACPNHYHEFLDGCVEGRRTSADFGKVAPMVEAVLLGNVAERVPDTLLNWDARRMRVTNSVKATRFLYRDYRPGWELKGMEAYA